ncbi:MAG TPA: hypothetical protein VGO93_05600 [Candidatus Xenobia bacterium]
MGLSLNAGKCTLHQGRDVIAGGERNKTFQIICLHNILEEMAKGSRNFTAMRAVIVEEASWKCPIAQTLPGVSRNP